MGQVKGCHLVGSVCLPDTETVFRKCAAGMPNRLKRIPDGETQVRQQFTVFQAAFFQSVPEMMTEFVNNAMIQSKEFTPQQVRDGIEKLKQAAPTTGYDSAAIESYNIFKKMRDEGVIAKGTRFQVCLPTLANVVLPFVQKAFMMAAEPVYEKAVFKAMRKIQDTIPHEDLSIQIDLAADTALWENVEMYRPWFHEDDKDIDKRKQYMVDYTVRMISQIDQDVEIGIHNCYGDMEHRHWREPESLEVITERGLAIFEATPHKIAYFHSPVPLSAMERLKSYYEPIVKLLPKVKEHDTELIFGLVHYDDLEGTRRRIEVAQKVLGDVDFGVGSECGWGRTPPGEIENIMKISSEVSEPVL